MILRIGIALDLSDKAPGLWDGDALQAASFLAMALNGSPLVEGCVALDTGSGTHAEARSPLPLMAWQEAIQRLDLIIEVGTNLPEPWARDFTAKGGAVVAQRIANDLVSDGESMAFARPAGPLPAPNFYREVWVWPAHAASCGSYLHYTTLTPVHVVPHLWSPAILEHAAPAWAYTPGRAAWRLAILEPNRSSVAACHMPMMLCDAAFRRQPKAVESLCIANSAHLLDGAHFGHFADSLDLVRQGRTQFYDAIPAHATLGARADALISHHWGSTLSYRHYEALHGGFPLIHNSGWLGDCGYRYTDFDPEDGADRLLDALRHHDRDLEAYQAKARLFLATLDPGASAQVHAYEQRLTALFPPG